MEKFGNKQNKKKSKKHLVKIYKIINNYIKVRANQPFFDFILVYLSFTCLHTNFS